MLLTKKQIFFKEGAMKVITEPDNVTINGQRFVKALGDAALQEQMPQIILADKGFVYIGICEHLPNGQVLIQQARNIRYWGTTAGIGQLKDGPTEKTILDWCGTVRVLPILTIETTPGAWGKVFQQASGPGNSLVLNGVTYISEGAASLQKQDFVSGDQRIIAADKSFVFVGTVQDLPNGAVRIENARNLRYWGTNQGMGQLTEGPTESTITDNYGIVTCFPIVEIKVASGW